MSRLPIRAVTRSVCTTIACFLTLAVHTEEHDEKWPQEWYEPFTTASVIGLTEYQQSPYLDNKGLPPVKDRLPKDPIVVYPLKTTGKYGGTAHIVNNDLWQFFQWEAALTISADMSSFFPNLAEWYELAEDGLSLTIKLREGIRWSDGEPLKSDDFIFTYMHLWHNKEYQSETYRLVRGTRAVKIDELTFRYEFPAPRPLFVNFVAQYGDFMIDPSHYMKQFHPDFTTKEELDARVKEYDMFNWTQLVNDIRREGSEQSVHVPTLRAYKLVDASPSRRKYVRNPYYYKVDPEGRQLPYIDEFGSEVVQEHEIMAAMASAGQLDFAAFQMRTQDIPLLKLGERNGIIKVHIWKRLHSSDVAIQPNYNHEDERLQELYIDKRFRMALSHAINRDEINDIVYFGRGTPRQVTVHPTSRFFKPEYATPYIEYDPEKSRALLDEIGLIDQDGDGYREHKDGSPFTITLEFYDFETPKGITMELVLEYWREIGIQLNLKNVNGDLQRERAIAGKMEMTLWHADRVTDILFPLFPDWWVARSISWDRGMWNDWSRWYMKRGQKTPKIGFNPNPVWHLKGEKVTGLGTEPPPVMRQLQDWTDEMWETLDEEERLKIGRKILEKGVENLWVIGTVGLAPHPVVVSKRLKGVPLEGIWGWDNRWTLANHPHTWYIEEEE